MLAALALYERSQLNVGVRPRTWFMSAAQASPHPMSHAIRIGVSTVLLALGACVSYEELARVTSPSGRVKAILVQSNGGATTSLGYAVLLRPARFGWGRSVEVALLDGAVKRNCAPGVTLHWQSAARHQTNQNGVDADVVTHVNLNFPPRLIRCFARRRNPPATYRARPRGNACAALPTRFPSRNSRTVYR